MIRYLDALILLVDSDSRSDVDMMRQRDSTAPTDFDFDEVDDRFFEFSQ